MAERRTFTKSIDGQRAVAIAYSPADAVRLVFDGWREDKPAPAAAAEPKTAAKKTAAKKTAAAVEPDPAREDK